MQIAVHPAIPARRTDEIVDKSTNLERLQQDFPLKRQGCLSASTREDFTKLRRVG